MRELVRYVALVLVTVALGGAACDGAGNGEPREPTLTAIRADIFDPRCSFAACHGGTNPQNDLDLEQDPFAGLVDVDSVGAPGVKRVVAGDPEASLLFQVLQGPVAGVRQMPIGATVLPEDLEQIRAWIEAGAAND